MLMILLSIVSVISHLICGNNLNWLQNLSLIYEILWTQARSGLLVSMLGKHIWFRSTGSYNTGSIDVKMDWSVLVEKSFFKMPGLIFSSKLDWGACIILIVKTASKKIGAWFILWSFFLPSLLCISINLPCTHARNTVVMSGLVFLVATWNC